MPISVPTALPLALLLAVSGGAVPTESPPPERCTAQVFVTLRWAGGYQGTVLVTNRGAAPMHAWYASWELPPGTALAQVWNGLAMVSGPTVMTHAPSWHDVLAPGDTVSAGFLVTGDPPTDPPHTLCG